jgi:hypothetical protein
LLFPSAEASDSDTIEQENTSLVLRLRRDFGNSSSIGALLTDREGNNYYNRLGGIDGLIRLNKSNKVGFQYVLSKTLYPEFIASDYDQKPFSFTGSAFKIIYSIDNRSYSLNTRYEAISPDFRADLGFIPQVDYKKYSFNPKYIHWGNKNSFFSIIEIGPDFTYITDYHGNLILKEAELEIDAQLPLQSTIYWNTTYRKKVYDNITFKNQLRNFFFFNCKPSGKIQIGTHLFFGDEIDYDNTKPAKMFELEPFITYSLGNNFSFSLSYLYNKLNVEEGKLYHAHLAEASIIYHFNTKTFFRAILQYVDISRNQLLYIDEVEPKERTFFTQLLFSYKLNPRTVIFIGYTDNRLGYLNTNLAQTDRTVFFKLGYAFNI